MNHRKWRLALGLVLVCGACGGGHAGPDGGVDALNPPFPDARPSGDGGSGKAGDFEACTTSDDCENPSSDCVVIPWYSSMVRQCLPRCGSTDECVYNTYCYPPGGGDLGSQFALMGGHCWYSLCGEDFAGRNGATGGPCELGAEAGVPGSERVAGFCVPIEDGKFGQCVESGDVPVGEACDFQEPVRGGDNCVQMALCVGFPGQPRGTCAEVCDPREILTGGDPGCPGSLGCQDISRHVTYNDGTTDRSTLGVCTGVVACSLVAANTCPDSTGGNPQACLATNSLRPTGVCHELGWGEAGSGEACDPPAEGTLAADRCGPGLYCFDPDDTGPFCQDVCDDTPTVKSPTAPCSMPAVCQRVRWSSGGDGVPGTPDDVLTADWGTCR